MLTTRVFRLFVSSTFSDFIAEREALQKEVFPELEKYCAERGARFQAVDLRWGITEEAQREHDTMRICLEEIRRCQKLSPRPNFAVLLGDRYGWEPVPARIPQDHWKRLIHAASSPDRNLIEDSYQLDRNAIPPVYCLHERAQDPRAFEREVQLLQALRRAARGFRDSARLPYFASATHQEIALGALSRRDEKRKDLNPEQHVHVYVRHLSGLPQDESAKDFIDWDSSTGQVVPGARQRLRGLEAQLRQRLGERVHDLHTTWSRHGRNGTVNKAYLKRFCDAFLSHQKALIDAELASLGQADERQQHERAHRDFGAERARVFAGRKALLGRIARYTATAPSARGARRANAESPAAPLILLGGGGSGKSALLARAAQDESKRSGAIVLQRYIGGVPGTESLMTTLTGLTADIASLYGQPEPPTPENAKALAEGFQAALGHATAKQPLILYLDALDQLDQADNAWSLEWLPRDLPEHVRVVVSMRTETNVAQATRRRYPRSLVQVAGMKPAEGQAMLNAWLADKRAAWFNAGVAPHRGRRLTSEQRAAVLATFNQNGSPLWLKLAYEEVATWASWEKPRKLSPTVQGLIEDLIDHRLIQQENHPKVFTERTLAYLTAGRFGLSESELGRALGTDQEVRAEFQANEKTLKKWEDNKQLPPILWSRLYFDLQDYLGLTQVDGALVMRWFHREFADVLKARFLGNEEDRETIHGALADTFLHLEWELRPNETNDDALFKATDATGKQVSAALRRVMEQPWQLAAADRQQELMVLLHDFGFCMAKCGARRSKDLIRDFVDSRALYLGSTALRGWGEFVLSVGHLLRSDLPAWPGHRIMLQLSLEELRLENRDAIWAWARCYADWTIVRSLPNLTSGCEHFPMVTFEGHKGAVLGVHLLPGNRILSWAENDKDIRIWNIFSGETQGFLRHGSNVVSVEVLFENRVLSSSQDGALNVWSLESQEQLERFLTWDTSRQGIGDYRSISSTQVAYWSSSGSLGDSDYVIGIRSLRTGELIARLPRSIGDGHTDYVINVITAIEDVLISWSHDQTVRRWRISSGKCEAASFDLNAPIVKVELSNEGSIHVYTRPSLHSCTTQLWELCIDTLLPLADVQEQPAPDRHENWPKVQLNKFSGEVRWQGNQITLVPLQSDRAEVMLAIPGQSVPSSESAPPPPLRLIALKNLGDDKILAGLSDASLVLFDAQTGATIDQLAGRADCAGSGCRLDGEEVAIWPIKGEAKNLLRIWHPGERLKVDKQYVSGGRIRGAEPAPGGLLTWGGQTVVRWNTNPLRKVGMLKHPSHIRFIRRTDESGSFASGDSEGNVALWQDHDPEGAMWLSTGRDTVDDARLDGADRLLISFRESGVDFIEGFSISSGTSLGVWERKIQKPPFSERRVVQPDNRSVEVLRNAVKFGTERGDVIYWLNRGANLDPISMTSRGVLVAKRGDELLLIDTAGQVRKTELDPLGQDLKSKKITDIDLVNLRLAPRRRVADKRLKPLSEDVFAALREWAQNRVLERLDSPDFKGSTWIGGGVFVMSAHSPRAKQEVRRYRITSWAHEDRFGLITHFPKAIDSLLKKMRNEVSPGSFMDKDHFYTDVAMAIAAAEERGEPLIDILLAGIDRAQELAREASAT